MKDPYSGISQSWQSFNRSFGKLWIALWASCDRWEIPPDRIHFGRCTVKRHRFKFDTVNS